MATEKSETFPLTQRIQAMKPSATVAISTKAKQLKADGVDVLSFSVGEPDFETPTHIRRAAIEAIESGCSHYTAARGIPSLRQAICQDSAERRGIEHKPEEVVVSVGAKHSLFNIALTLFEGGDEVLIPAPYWVSYPAQVELAQATPKIIETTKDDGYLMTPEQLRAAIGPKTKGLILCSPSNPTGAAYSRSELEALADVLRDSKIWIIVDEIYGRLVYGDFEQHSLLSVAPDLRDRTIIVDGVSKTFAMTGWRIGWMLGPAAVAQACDKLQGQGTTNPTAVAQYAAIAALQGPQEPVEEMRAIFEKRRARMVEGLRAIKGLKCEMPQGAFYAFCNVEEVLASSALDDDLALAGYLLDEARCAVVPGSAFGAPGHLRISYACSERQIDEGLSRIEEALAKL